MPIKMEPSKLAAELHAAIVDVDDDTGKAIAIRRHTVGGG
jgi:calcineurin-like phosphoesterase